jgi:nicotinate phosphoribosyltransferase
LTKKYLEMFGYRPMSNLALATIANPGLADPGLSVTPDDYSLLTDLYQLTMSACYQGEGLDQRWSSFELTVRRLPSGYNYLIAMGLAQAVDYLQQFRFSPAQIQYLQATGLFAHAQPAFWQLLAQARFSGNLWAVPEGTVLFANQPFLRIEAPLWQAQLVETYLLNTINYQTLIATRAARLRDTVTPGTQLLEFGSRRAFSPQASVWAARAALAAGFDATSNVLAAAKLGVKPAGTMAHALVMALAATEGSEAQAFAAFNRYFPNSTFLIDTYDTLAAAQTLAHLHAKGEVEIGGIRLDSGDLATLSQAVSKILPGVPIIASGDLDEHRIVELQQQGANIQGYGIGTKLVTGEPVNGVYKLVEVDGIPVMKESSGKVTYPGRKQIFRATQEGLWQQDYLGLISEPTPAHCQALLQPILMQGELCQARESLDTIRQRTRAGVTTLPLSYRQPTHPPQANPHLSPVLLSADLTALIERTCHPAAVPV